MSIHVKDLPSTRTHVLGKDSGHFPAIASAGGEHAIIVYRAGAGHMGKGGRLDAVISEDGGESWSEPVLVADDEWDVRETGIGVAPSGVIVAGYMIDKNYTDEPRGYDKERKDYETWITRSHDGGRTWEKPYPLSCKEFWGYSPYRQNLLMPDGSMLMAAYGNPTWHQSGAEAKGSVLLRSADEGLTWGLWSEVSRDMNESAFLFLKDGSLLAVMRSEENGSLYSSFGDKDGRSWTEPVKIVNHHPASLARLSSGAILLAHGVRTGPSGARGLISTDEGKTWPKEREIIFGDNATNWDCGYANALVLPSGRLIVAYYTTAQEDPWRCEGAHCHVVVCSEKEVLDAVGL